MVSVNLFGVQISTTNSEGIVLLLHKELYSTVQYCTVLESHGVVQYFTCVYHDLMIPQQSVHIYFITKASYDNHAHSIDNNTHCNGHASNNRWNVTLQKEMKNIVFNHWSFLFPPFSFPLFPLM